MLISPARLPLNIIPRVCLLRSLVSAPGVSTPAQSASSLPQIRSEPSEDGGSRKLSEKS